MSRRPWCLWAPVVAWLVCCAAIPAPVRAADVAPAPVQVVAPPPPAPAGFDCRGHCAATLLVGPQLTTSMSRVYGVHDTLPYVPPWAYSYGDSWFVGGALSYRLLGNAEFASIEIEGGVGQRFGSLDQTEVWAALYGRWSWFPWNHLLRTSIAISTGVNYATSATEREIYATPDLRSPRLLHYLSPEITFALPQYPDKIFLIRLHHRSGGGDWWVDNVPVYGGAFRGNRGGAQYLTFGLRQIF